MTTFCIGMVLSSKAVKAAKDNLMRFGGEAIDEEICFGYHAGDGSIQTWEGSVEDFVEALGLKFND